MSESLISAEVRSDCSVEYSNAASPLCSVSKRSYEFGKKIVFRISARQTLEMMSYYISNDHKPNKDQYFYQIWKSSISLKIIKLVMNFYVYTAHGMSLHLKKHCIIPRSDTLQNLILNLSDLKRRYFILSIKDLVKKLPVEWSQFRILKKTETKNKTPKQWGKHFIFLQLAGFFPYE